MNQIISIKEGNITRRPGDGKALETSFTITVVSDGSSGSGDDTETSSGSDHDGGHF